MCLVGHALAELHGYRAREKLRPADTREQEAASLRPIAHAVGQAHPRAAERIARLAERLGAWLMARPPVDRAIHGDFYSKQVLLQQGGTVAFLGPRRGAAGIRRRTSATSSPTSSGTCSAAGWKPAAPPRSPRHCERVTPVRRRRRRRCRADVYRGVLGFALSPWSRFGDRQLGWPRAHRPDPRPGRGTLRRSGDEPHVGGQGGGGRRDVEMTPPRWWTRRCRSCGRRWTRRTVQRELENGLVRPETSDEHFRLRAIRVVRHKPGRPMPHRVRRRVTRGGGEPHARREGAGQGLGRFHRITSTSRCGRPVSTTPRPTGSAFPSPSA